jgi:hypothetical protein
MRIQLFFLLVLAGAAALLQCKSAAKPAMAGGEKLLYLETTPCFGYCPVFNVTVSTDGTVDYEGIRSVEVVGKKQVKLTAPELERLRKKIDEVDLWKYPDNIKTDVTDAPWATIVVYKGGQSKSVKGSVDRPEPVLQLEELVKDLVEAHGIVVKKGVPGPKGGG